MPVDIARFFSFKGYAVSSEDIQFGETASQEVTINYNGVLTPVRLKKRNVTITLRGLKQAQANDFIREADRTAHRLIQGATDGEDLEFGIRTIRNAVLTNAVASTPIQVGSTKLVESLQLTYESLVFD